ncbi:MAG TPA: OmpA family protein [Cytophagaceae bacterium]|jgi:outer membrane protein OmpA-like peptidoglycan-associated protein|nr:OmpA family protein [Cytophagaceae bacterium]
MKKYNFIVAFLLLVSSAFAQTDILFNDDFIDNRYNWWEGKATHKNLFSNGTYIIRSGVLDTKGMAINPKKDFAVEVILKQTEGPVNQIFGIACGQSSIFSFLFVITSNGGFLIFGYQNNKSVTFKDWDYTYAKIIKPINFYNKLRVEQKGTATSFYINEIKVYTATNMAHLNDNRIGMDISQGISVAVDKFTVYQKSSPINLLPGYSTEYKKENLGPNVNSKYEDSEPIISHDGKFLFFRRYDNLVGPNYSGEANCGDVYMTSLLDNGSWSKAEKLPAPVNNSHNNELIGVSPDNNTLWMGDTNCLANMNNFKYWESRRAAGGWTVPKPVKIINPGNHNQYFTATIAADGQTSMLAIERNDSYGSMDIYVCFLRNEVWTEPQNLGPVINTIGLDSGPFLAADNQTMYYATDGKAGYGSLDIFVTRRLDDTWLNWSEPQNLGPGVNSTGTDEYYSVPASGEYAYFHTTVNSIGEEDIFRIKLPKAAKPEPVVLVHGKVLNTKTKAPVSAAIHYEILPDGKDLGSASSNPTTGEYKIILPYGEHYAYHASAPGYIEMNENFDLIEKKDYIEINKDLYLTPIEVGAKINLNNVFFEQSKPVLLSSSYPELDRLVQIMNENPVMEIELRGHTDNTGDAAKNIKLSEDRVNIVKEYLVSKGISAKRITGKGFGGIQPLNTNGNEESRKQNRRVEFVVTKK